MFHVRNAGVKLTLGVNRHPYSWAGDDRTVDQGKFKMFSEGEFMRQERAARGNESVPFKKLTELAAEASIKLNKDGRGVEMRWQPIDAQRLLLWASRFGRMEHLAENMSKRHFEENESCADRENLINAVRDTPDLDVQAAQTFLSSDELVQDVWDSYGRMIRYWGIKEIPVFIFNRPQTPSVFSLDFDERRMKRPYIAVGATDEAKVVEIFELIMAESDQQSRTAKL